MRRRLPDMPTGQHLLDLSGALLDVSTQVMSISKR